MSVPLRTIGMLRPLPPLDPADTEPTCIQRRICRFCSNDEESPLQLELALACDSILRNGGSLVEAQCSEPGVNPQHRTG